MQYLMEGKTTCIKDFSPTQSDSVNSETATPSEDDVDTSSGATNMSTSSERLLLGAAKFYKTTKVPYIGKGEVLYYDEMII